MTERVLIQLTPELLARLDAAAGPNRRSEYIRALLERELERDEGSRSRR